MKVWLAGLVGALFLAAGADPFAAVRERMVWEQIELRGVHNPDVLRVMRATPRHLFVPKGLVPQAYADHPLPIGYGATISQPLIVAMMTELLAPSTKDRVLEIGTGSGYQAAVLSPLAAEVYSIEIVPELARSAAALLAGMGYKNVTVRQGDGYLGWPEKAPFHRIILTAAPPQVPRALLDQLAAGGRLVAPLGVSPFDQYLYLVEKNARGEIRYRKMGAVAFVPMVSKD
ncbi:MAG TPA: protein-L-isoaspartate(D-aspartate) O-methyltransferase [Bryobacteraceae bacterium]|nr:protein-L-isoaspartate(D-aspartate) O-methyltransferase [Bryobacteraceae bacterium]